MKTLVFHGTLGSLIPGHVAITKSRLYLPGTLGEYQGVSFVPISTVLPQLSRREHILGLNDTQLLFFYEFFKLFFTKCKIESQNADSMRTELPISHEKVDLTTL
jgi:hypothetical protein